ncbi:putative membrane protein (TIGR04086 family) [Paenibacillus castaneae]|uniref:TIGR04086 family membrane protein n=1 Tax=Paenibacillus castaneae TaxID=474957 RepID=UPI000C9CAF04|nr:TIGR04086 family membrane protein [Paenibacillus castaneae]NIK75942.1 putative membrane protein (TIGR04086 family) [Paenibacillus castaneae]
MSSVKQAPKPPLIASPLLAGILFSIVWLAAGALLLSLLLHFTDMKESNLSSSAFVIHSMASLAGGYTAGKRSERKGWYNGALLGLLYGLLIILVSFLASNASLSMNSVLLLAAALLIGAFGGMIGVNMRRQT